MIRRSGDRVIEVLSPGQLRKAAIISAAGAPLIRALGSTYRWHVDGYQHYESITAAARQPIFAFWHGRILPATLFWKNRGIVVITSQNFDGEWIAGIIRRFGYDTARGSSSRGGARALVQLRRDLAAGKPAAFTIDGPRGPARVAQPGAVFLAGATGQPILPFHVEASAAWTMNSWDRTQIPKPFARVAVAIGQPVEIRDTHDTAVRDGLEQLQHTLSSLEQRAAQLLASERRKSSHGTHGKHGYQ
ncbi:MAG TPA: lysophospholipid acyltransferase family protein [Vicinamibacterales bacterium]|nr:lysophospholipid acyltransferase family protein [Vicinamibacterales bacterium]